MTYTRLFLKYFPQSFEVMWTEQLFLVPLVVRRQMSQFKLLPSSKGWQKRQLIAKCHFQKKLVQVRNRTLIKAKHFISDLGGNFLSVKVVIKNSNHSNIYILLEKQTSNIFVRFFLQILLIACTTCEHVRNGFFGVRTNQEIHFRLK